MEWTEKVKQFFSPEKKNLTHPETRKEAFFLLTEIYGSARWNDFAAVARQTIITRDPVLKPSFAEMEAEMRDVQRFFAPWLD